ncbi:nitrite reductase, partial [Salmonella enterica]|nr:nitrite reductase [Salmonella sp. 15E126]
VTAFLLLAITWVIRAIGKTAPFQFLGRHLARIGASKWVQRTVAVMVLAGGLAITVYAYWLNHGS